MSEPGWLETAKKLSSIAQVGLAYARDPFDRERYEMLRGIAADILAQGAGESIEAVEGLLAREEGYATPKVDVRGAVFRDGKILLVRERSDGLWTLPGGWADVCESPAANVEREVLEESGHHVRATKLAAVLDRSLHAHAPPFAFHVYKLFFVCELLGGDPGTSHEISEVGFFGETEIPPLSRGRVLSEQIALMFEHSRDPSLPTRFD